MAGASKKTLKSGLRRAWYNDFSGKRVFFTQRGGWKEVNALADTLEAQHRERRLKGDVPKSWEQAECRDIAEVMEEYQSWGQSCGGRKGRPWSDTHKRNRKAFLRFWRQSLGLKTMADLCDVLPRVEVELRKLQDAGRPGKTLQNYADGICAFCDWCVQRGYLSIDPMKGLAKFDCTPITTRRALTIEEISKLLEHCLSNDRRLVYEVAIVSGLRANELRNLIVADLDLERCGLNLQSSWTKNRMQGFQPLPTSIMSKLIESVKGKPANDSLIRVPADTHKSFDRDIGRAGIPKGHF
jgi:integrase